MIADSRIALLEDEKLSSYAAFTNLLKIEQEKVQYHKEMFSHMENLAGSFREEKEYYIKRERKQRRKKNVLGYAVLILAGALVVK